MAGVSGRSQGRRGYYLYEYGTHLWFPQVQADFSGGMFTDIQPTSIPPNGVLFIRDFIPSPHGHLYKRGGSTYLNSSATGNTNHQFVIASKFTTGCIVVANNGHLYKITGPGTVSDVSTLGTDFATTHSGTYINNGGTNTLYLAVCNGDGGTTAPKLYDGTSVTNLGGSPPTASVCCTHLNRLVLARSAANPNRIWFSPVPDITTTWDTTNAWIDVPYPIEGLISINDVLLIFTKHGVWKIIGDTPPPGSNMSLRKVSDEGVYANNSFCAYGNQAIYFNTNDIWATDGVTTTSLTLNAITNGWRTYIATADATASVGPIGIFANQYLFIPMGATTNSVLCYLPNRAWGTWIPQTTSGSYTAMASSYSGETPELYLVDNGSVGKVQKLSTFFTPGNSYKYDADGSTSVLPSIFTRAFGTFPFLCAFGKAHLTYKLTDASSDNPQFSQAFVLADGTAGSSTTIPKASTLTRKRFSLGNRSEFGSVHLTQVNPSGTTHIYSIEVDTRGFPREAGGQ